MKKNKFNCVLIIIDCKRLLFLYFHSIQDYDYYDRYDDNRDLFDRRYSGMGNSGMRSSGRDFIPMGRRDPMPLPPSLGGGSMRGLSSSNSMRGSSGYDSMFSRRTPPRSSKIFHHFSNNL